MKIFKNLNAWLNEHYFLWEEEEKEGIVRLWALLITIVLFVTLGLWFKEESALVIQIWAGLVTFASPLIAALKALFTRSKWNPWYWFPIIKGGIIGGLIAMLIVWVCRTGFGL